MLQIILNDKLIQNGYTPPVGTKICSLEFITHPLLKVMIHPHEKLAWADYFWGLIELCDEDTIIIYQGIIGYKSEVKRYEGK